MGRFKDESDKNLVFVSPFYANNTRIAAHLLINLITNLRTDHKLSQIPNVRLYGVSSNPKLKELISVVGGESEILSSLVPLATKNLIDIDSSKVYSVSESVVFNPI